MNLFFVRNSCKANCFFLLIGWIAIIIYLSWEYYWFTKVSWGFIKWHTHLFSYYFLLLLILTINKIWTLSSNLILILSSVLITLAAVEVTFLFFKTYPDADFLYRFKYSEENYYHTWPENDAHYLKREGEFNFPRTTNSYGFSDREWQKEKSDNKIRIITLGDSFTEGDGAPADSAYPALLQNILGQNFEVFNAGTCGSDPIHNFKNMEDRLAVFSPDIVFQTISSQDLFDDISLRGGFERLAKSNNTAFANFPLWVYPAMVSCIARQLFRSLGFDDANLFPQDKDWQNKIKTFEVELTERYAALNQTHPFTLVFVVLPVRDEVKNKKYKLDFTDLKKQAAASKYMAAIDLLPCYIDKIEQSKTDYSNYYWVVDAHHNATGYRMMAECIADYLLSDTTLAK